MRLDDEQVAFCLGHRVFHFDERSLRFLVERLTSRDDHVFDVRGGGARAFVALIDRVTNESDSAVLEVMAAEGEIGEVLRLVANVLPAAIELARAGPRGALDVPMRGRLLEHGEALLAPRGFAIAYRDYVMRTADARFVRRAAPSGLLWVDLDAELAGRVHPFLAAAFEGIAGFMLPSEEETRRRSLAHRPAPRLLIDERDRELAGFLRVRVDEGGVGYVEMIARAPARRGEGLGPVVLSEALRVLSEAGVESFALDVAADNERALALYRDNGFAIASSDAVWRMRL